MNLDNLCNQCNVIQNKCDFCDNLICLNVICEWEDNGGKKCNDCDKHFCHGCGAVSCGYCSDPAGLKKYYCKNHGESICYVCEDVVCEYCTKNTIYQYDNWCCDCDKPIHYYCIKEHICSKITNKT